MSASAGILVDVLSKIVLTQNTISSESQLNSTNCHLNSAKTTNIAELSFRTSRSSSQQNLETDSAKSSCSPAQLDLSFDSGIGGIGVAGGEIDDGALKDLPELCTTNATTGAIVSCRGDDANTITAIGIGSGISCNAEEQMRQKLRYERLQQWRLILLALDRQKDPYRLLRERLSFHRMRNQIQVAEFPTINKCNNLLAGISAVVGVIGGVCLLTSAAKTLIDKIGERRFIGKGPADNHNCHACSCAIQQLDSNSFVTCSLCNKRICRSAKCSKWMPNSGGWECQICHLAKDSLTQTQSWVAEQMSFNHQKFVYPMRARSEIYIPIGDSKESSLHFESVSQVNLNSAAITAEQKLKIREYVEEVVSNLLGGSLDQVRISQLSKSENYLPSIINTNAIPQSLVASNNSQSNDIPNVNMPPEFAGVSQMRLRHMIESIIAEMLHLPSLTNGAGTSDVDHNMDAPDNEIAMTMSLEKENIGIRHRHKNYFEPKIYHDLLATAVLNKISDKEGNIRQFSESTPDLSITNIDSNFNVENQSTTSGSSVEPMSDISYTDTEQSPKISKVFGRESVLSDYIAAHTVPLPDLSAAATESEDDHASISSSILAEGTWEDNWLFKKKRSSLTTSMTGSIGMLVPAPKNDIRAQIGDKTADEISDLSEIGSDTDESSANMDSANLDPLNNRILNKQLIGGKNTKEALDELIETTSLISNTSAALNEPKYTETRNEYVVETASKIEATNPNIVNHSAQEAQMISVNPEKRGEQNPLSAPSQLNEDIQDDESCTGFSTVEMYEKPPSYREYRTICQGPSVIEILAAIALGPMLAVPTSDQPPILTSDELSSLKELSDLALAEIKARSHEVGQHSLDVIDEEEEMKITKSYVEEDMQLNVEDVLRNAATTTLEFQIANSKVHNTTAEVSENISEVQGSAKQLKLTPHKGSIQHPTELSPATQLQEELTSLIASNKDIVLTAPKPTKLEATLISECSNGTEESTLGLVHDKFILQTLETDNSSVCEPKHPSLPLAFSYEIKPNSTDINPAVSAVIIHTNTTQADVAEPVSAPSDLTLPENTFPETQIRYVPTTLISEIVEVDNASDVKPKTPLMQSDTTTVCATLPTLDAPLTAKAALILETDEIEPVPVPTDQVLLQITVIQTCPESAPENLNAPALETANASTVEPKVPPEHSDETELVRSQTLLTLSASLPDTPQAGEAESVPALSDHLLQDTSLPQTCLESAPEALISPTVEIDNASDVELKVPPVPSIEAELEKSEPVLTQRATIPDTPQADEAESVASPSDPIFLEISPPQTCLESAPEAVEIENVSDVEAKLLPVPSNQTEAEKLESVHTLSATIPGKLKADEAESVPAPSDPILVEISIPQTPTESATEILNSPEAKVESASDVSHKVLPVLSDETEFRKSEAVLIRSVTILATPQADGADSVAAPGDPILLEISIPQIPTESATEILKSLAVEAENTSDVNTKLAPVLSVGTKPGKSEPVPTLSATILDTPQSDEAESVPAPNVPILQEISLPQTAAESAPDTLNSQAGEIENVADVKPNVPPVPAIEAEPEKSELVLTLSATIPDTPQATVAQPVSSLCDPILQEIILPQTSTESAPDTLSTQAAEVENASDVEPKALPVPSIKAEPEKSEPVLTQRATIPDTPQADEAESVASPSDPIFLEISPPQTCLESAPEAVEIENVSDVEAKLLPVPSNQTEAEKLESVHTLSATIPGKLKADEAESVPAPSDPILVEISIPQTPTESATEILNSPEAKVESASDVSRKVLPVLSDETEFGKSEAVLIRSVTILATPQADGADSVAAPGDPILLEISIPQIPTESATEILKSLAVEAENTSDVNTKLAPVLSVGTKPGKSEPVPTLSATILDTPQSDEAESVPAPNVPILQEISLPQTAAESAPDTLNSQAGEIENVADVKPNVPPVPAIEAEPEKSELVLTLSATIPNTPQADETKSVAAPSDPILLEISTLQTSTESAPEILISQAAEVENTSDVEPKVLPVPSAETEAGKLEYAHNLSAVIPATPQVDETETVSAPSDPILLEISAPQTCPESAAEPLISQVVEIENVSDVEPNVLPVPSIEAEPEKSEPVLTLNATIPDTPQTDEAESVPVPTDPILLEISILQTSPESAPETLNSHTAEVENSSDVESKVLPVTSIEKEPEKSEPVLTLNTTIPDTPQTDEAESVPVPTDPILLEISILQTSTESVPETLISQAAEVENTSDVEPKVLPVPSAETEAEKFEYVHTLSAAIPDTPQTDEAEFVPAPCDPILLEISAPQTCPESAAEPLISQVVEIGNVSDVEPNVLPVPSIEAEPEKSEPVLTLNAKIPDTPQTDEAESVPVPTDPILLEISILQTSPESAPETLGSQTAEVENSSDVETKVLPVPSIEKEPEKSEPILTLNATISDTPQTDEAESVPVPTDPISLEISILQTSTESAPETLISQAAEVENTSDVEPKVLPVPSAETEAEKLESAHNLSAVIPATPQVDETESVSARSDPILLEISAPQTCPEPAAEPLISQVVEIKNVSDVEPNVLPVPSIEAEPEKSELVLTLSTTIPDTPQADETESVPAPNDPILQDINLPQTCLESAPETFISQTVEIENASDVELKVPPVPLIEAELEKSEPVITLSATIPDTPQATEAQSVSSPCDSISRESAPDTLSSQADFENASDVEPKVPLGPSTEAEPERSKPVLTLSATFPHSPQAAEAQSVPSPCDRILQEIALPQTSTESAPETLISQAVEIENMSDIKTNVLPVLSDEPEAEKFESVHTLSATIADTSQADEAESLPAPTDPTLLEISILQTSPVSAPETLGSQTAEVENSSDVECKVLPVPSIEKEPEQSEPLLTLSAKIPDTSQADEAESVPAPSDPVLQDISLTQTGVESAPETSISQAVEIENVSDIKTNVLPVLSDEPEATKLEPVLTLRATIPDTPQADEAESLPAPTDPILLEISILQTSTESAPETLGSQAVEVENASDVEPKVLPVPSIESDSEKSEPVLTVSATIPDTPQTDEAESVSAPSDPILLEIAHSQSSTESAPDTLNSLAAEVENASDVEPKVPLGPSTEAEPERSKPVLTLSATFPHSPQAAEAQSVPSPCDRILQEIALPQTSTESAPETLNSQALEIENASDVDPKVPTEPSIEADPEKSEPVLTLSPTIPDTPQADEAESVPASTDPILLEISILKTSPESAPETLGSQTAEVENSSDVESKVLPDPSIEKEQEQSEPVLTLSAKIPDTSQADEAESLPAPTDPTLLEISILETSTDSAPETLGSQAGEVKNASDIEPKVLPVSSIAAEPEKLEPVLTLAATIPDTPQATETPTVPSIEAAPEKSEPVLTLSATIPDTPQADEAESLPAPTDPTLREISILKTSPESAPETLGSQTAEVGNSSDVESKVLPVPSIEKEPEQSEPVLTVSAKIRDTSQADEAESLPAPTDPTLLEISILQTSTESAPETLGSQAGEVENASDVEPRVLTVPSIGAEPEKSEPLLTLIATLPDTSQADETESVPVPSDPVLQDISLPQTGVESAPETSISQAVEIANVSDVKTNVLPVLSDEPEANKLEPVLTLRATIPDTPQADEAESLAAPTDPTLLEISILQTSTESAPETLGSQAGEVENASDIEPKVLPVSSIAAKPEKLEPVLTLAATIPDTPQATEAQSVSSPCDSISTESAPDTLSSEAVEVENASDVEPRVLTVPSIGAEPEKSEPLLTLIATLPDTSQADETESVPVPSDPVLQDISLPQTGVESAPETSISQAVEIANVSDVKTNVLPVLLDEPEAETLEPVHTLRATIPDTPQADEAESLPAPTDPILLEISILQTSTESAPETLGSQPGEVEHASDVEPKVLSVSSVEAEPEKLESVHSLAASILDTPQATEAQAVSSPCDSISTESAPDTLSSQAVEVENASDVEPKVLPVPSIEAEPEKSAPVLTVSATIRDTPQTDEAESVAAPSDPILLEMPQTLNASDVEPKVPLGPSTEAEPERSKPVLTLSATFPHSPQAAEAQSVPSPCDRILQEIALPQTSTESAPETLNSQALEIENASDVDPKVPTVPSIEADPEKSEPVLTLSATIPDTPQADEADSVPAPTDPILLEISILQTSTESAPESLGSQAGEVENASDIEPKVLPVSSIEAEPEKLEPVLTLAATIPDTPQATEAQSVSSPCDSISTESAPDTLSSEAAEVGNASDIEPRVLTVPSIEAEPEKSEPLLTLIATIPDTSQADETESVPVPSDPVLQDISLPQTGVESAPETSISQAVEIANVSDVKTNVLPVLSDEPEAEKLEPVHTLGATIPDTSQADEAESLPTPTDPILLEISILQTSTESAPDTLSSRGAEVENASDVEPKVLPVPSIKAEPEKSEPVLTVSATIPDTPQTDEAESVAAPSDPILLEIALSQSSTESAPETLGSQAGEVENASDVEPKVLPVPSIEAEPEKSEPVLTVSATILDTPQADEAESVLSPCGSISPESAPETLGSQAAEVENASDVEPKVLPVPSIEAEPEKSEPVLTVSATIPDTPQTDEAESVAAPSDPILLEIALPQSSTESAPETLGSQAGEVENASDVEPKVLPVPSIEAEPEKSEPVLTVSATILDTPQADEAESVPTPSDPILLETSVLQTSTESAPETLNSPAADVENALDVVPKLRQMLSDETDAEKLEPAHTLSAIIPDTPQADDAESDPAPSGPMLQGISLPQTCLKSGREIFISHTVEIENASDVEPKLPPEPSNDVDPEKPESVFTLSATIPDAPQADESESVPAPGDPILQEVGLPQTCLESTPQTLILQALQAKNASEVEPKVPPPASIEMEPEKSETIPVSTPSDPVLMEICHPLTSAESAPETLNSQLQPEEAESVSAPCDPVLLEISLPQTSKESGLEALNSQAVEVENASDVEPKVSFLPIVPSDETAPEKAKALPPETIAENEPAIIESNRQTENARTASAAKFLILTEISLPETLRESVIDSLISQDVEIEDSSDVKRKAPSEPLECLDKTELEKAEPAAIHRAIIPPPDVPPTDATETVPPPSKPKLLETILAEQLTESVEPKIPFSSLVPSDETQAKPVDPEAIVVESLKLVDESQIQNLTERCSSDISLTGTTGENFSNTRSLGPNIISETSGSIAEREYKKWNNAVEMPNNPYAPEALKRRISGSQERFMDLPNINLSTDNNPISLIKTTRAEEEVKGECCSDIDYKRYSRDYYINDDKGPKTSPKRQVVTNDSYRLHPNVSDDPIEDIAINENLNEQNVTHEIETPIEPHSMVYQALPAQVVEETASIETISNQSIQSVNTTTSDDSDTVRIYDFKKQQTTTVRNLDKTPASTKGESIAEGSIEPKLQPTATISTSMEDSPPKGQHPTQLPLEANVNSSIVIETQPAITPTRSSTPMAFKFLQPKRRLIDPSQILSLDEGADALTISPPGEKAVVEEELAQVMPSVKALAQAFLLSSNKCSHGETRWKKRLQNMPALSGKSHTKQEPMKKTEASLSIAEIAEDATIASDLSSLETDPPTNKDLFAAKSSEGLTSVPLLATTPPSNPATNVESNRSATTNALRRVSLLKSNIAFFENLKFK